MLSVETVVVNRRRVGKNRLDVLEINSTVTGPGALVGAFFAELNETFAIESEYLNYPSRRSGKRKACRL
jgi:hypothetical protein